MPPGAWSREEAYKPTADELAGQPWRQLALCIQQQREWLRTSGQHPRLVRLRPFPLDCEGEGNADPHQVSLAIGGLPQDSGAPHSNGPLVLATRCQPFARHGRMYRVAGYFRPGEAMTKEVGEVDQGMSCLASTPGTAAYGTFKGTVFVARRTDGHPLVFQETLIQQHPNCVSDICISGDGKRVFSVCEGFLCCWDAETLDALRAVSVRNLHRQLPLRSPRALRLCFIEEGALPDLGETIVLWARESGTVSLLHGDTLEESSSLGPNLSTQGATLDASCIRHLVPGRCDATVGS